MSFGFSLIEFAEELASSINRIRLQLLGGPPPPILLHYTKEVGAKGIAASRILRATCAADLGDKDKTEIEHGAELVRTLLKNDLRGFPAEVLSRVPDQLISRIPFAFVACFCSEERSAFHDETYGNYCLRFETDQRNEPLLRPIFGSGEVGYHRVVYGEDLQSKTARRVLRDCASALIHASKGQNKGPWASSIADIAARNATELLLDLVVAFKNKCYERDKEWRLSVRPRTLCASDPGWNDQQFLATVRSDNRKRYVELGLPATSLMSGLSLRPPVPFSSVAVRTQECLETMKRILSENDLPDIPVDLLR